MDEPAPCPLCGAYSGTTLAAQSSALLAVADVLVVRALEVTGKRIVRKERHRHQVLGDRPWHVAHTLWTPESNVITGALKGAWDIIPAMLDAHGCCGVSSRQVALTLDGYVRDLLITGTPHALPELRYRMESRLGVALPVMEGQSC